MDKPIRPQKEHDGHRITIHCVETGAIVHALYHHVENSVDFSMSLESKTIMFTRDYWMVISVDD